MLRFSNVYGPYSEQKGSVVAQFFRNLLRCEPIVIYGDGKQTRDFCTSRTLWKLFYWLIELNLRESVSDSFWKRNVDSKPSGRDEGNAACSQV